jgi:hypothetical protein
MVDRHWAHLLAGGFVLGCMATGAVLGVIVTAIRCVIGAGNA